MTGKGRLVFKITFVAAILSYSFWSHIKEWFDIQIFYPTVALCFLGYTYVIYEFVKEGYKVDKKLSSMLLWSEVILMTNISSVLDELFFDPTKLGVNEYIGFFLIILTALYNERKRQKRNE